MNPRGTSPLFVNLRGRPFTRLGRPLPFGEAARAAAAPVPSRRIHPTAHDRRARARRGVTPSSIRDLFRYSRHSDVVTNASAPVARTAGLAPRVCTEYWPAGSPGTKNLPRWSALTFR